MSHLTSVRQKNRIPIKELTLGVTDHDRERAEDIVGELERLGVYREPLLGEQPDDRETSELPETGASPRTESKRQPLTDLWGNPINKRGRRNR